jgi:hypothetical protein
MAEPSESDSGEPQGGEACAEEPQTLDAMPNSDDASPDKAALAGGPGSSLAWSLLALVLVAANSQLIGLLQMADEPPMAFSICIAVAMAVALLIAIPSWVASTAFAFGSLVTGQRRWYLAVVALLLNAASAAVFLLVV